MKTLTILWILLLCWAGPAHSATLNVPGQYPTIQAAINAAMDGDLVLVDPGTYLENIDFYGKAVTVKSAQGPEETTIDGGCPSNPLAASVVTFRSGEGRDSVIEGFTITNGQGTLWWNNAEFIGGGICCWDMTSPTIRNNVIRDNTILFDVVDGAGICCAPGSAPLIEGNVIKDNVALSPSGYGFGGGVACGYDTQAEVVNNLIINNRLNYTPGLGVGGGGESFFMAGSHAGGRVMVGGGGGIAFGEHAYGVLENNTICGNAAVDGGGIAVFYSSLLISVRNTVLWDNHAKNEGNEIFLALGALLSIDYSDVQGGLDGVSMDPTCMLDWGDGMIDADPCFEDPDAGDFHLTRRSPCINMGTNVGAPSQDLDGDPRPCNGTVDLGCDEFMGPHTLEADLFELPEDTGGWVNLILQAGVENGGRMYMILGSVTGSVPGIPLPGGTAVLPVHWDVFTDITVQNPNMPCFCNFQGNLDPSGGASAGFDTVGGLSGLAGVTFTFAYVLNSPFDFVSNPVNIQVVP